MTIEQFPVGPGHEMAISTEPKEIRAKIETLESQLKELPQVPIEPVHRFGGGIYAREITIPKDTVLTGKIHLFEHINIISKGDISVLTEDGIKRIQAPFTMVSRPGTKRVGYAHEETVWTTIHATQETDLEKLETLLIAKSFDQVDQLSEKEISQLKEAVWHG